MVNFSALNHRLMNNRLVILIDLQKAVYEGSSKVLLAQKKTKSEMQKISQAIESVIPIIDIIAGTSGLGIDLISYLRSR